MRARAAFARRAAGSLAAHPRHILLGALVAGLLAGPRAAGLLVALALSAAIAVHALGGAGRLLRAGAAAALLLAGGVLAQARLAALERTALAPLHGHVLSASAVLLQAPRAAPFGGRSALVRLRGEPVLLRAGEHVRWPRGAGVGDIVTVRGALRAAGTYAARLHAHAEWRADVVRTTGRRRGGLAGAVDAVRRRAERALEHGLPPPQAALLRGMVLGQDAALPDRLRDDFRAAGLSHLVAASGQNVVLLTALALAVATALGLGFHARWAVVLGLIALYVPLAGAGPSIQRAGVMGAASVVAVLAGRPGSRWYALALAAAATLALDPRAAQDAGWQMSFAAVLALLVLARPWAAALRRRGLPAGLAEATAVTAAATLGTAPLVAAHFDRVSLVALPANVLAAALVAPVMWLGMLAALTGQAGDAAPAVLDALAGYPLGCLTGLARAAAGVPGAQVAAGPLPVLAALATVVAGVAAGRRAARGSWGRHGALLAVLGVLALAAGGVVAARGGGPVAPPPPGALRVTFLDVGQGDATLLQSGAVSVLVDAGPPDGGIVGRLRRAGVGRLDLLVVTHAEADHAGGAAAVLAALPVGAVLDGRDGVRSADGARFAAAAAARRVRALAPAAGEALRVGGLALRILSPRPEAAAAHAGANPNDRAIVLEAAAAGARVLLPADAESPVLAGLDLRRADVLKVPHHGSADPGLPGVLARVAPRVAVIEVGAHNTYGHPAPQALQALAGARVPVVARTDRDGTVRLDLDGGRWQVHTRQ
jgi:competence protein ComEC